jgi:thymidylate kinase
MAAAAPPQGEQLAPLIAVVGCDGSGKSTLAADLLAHVRRSRPAETVYLGLGSGTLGNRIKAWPLVGPVLERFLTKKADRARDSSDRIPGLATAIVLYVYSLKRRRAFRRLLALRRRGVVVVTDRYPQVEVPGFYDGPGLSAARAEGWIVRRLAARERRIYEWMAGFVPTLVIRLNIDVETALARKPDHARALIERKVAATPKLSFNHAPLVDLSATMPYPQELAEAQGLVDAAIAGR